MNRGTSPKDEERSPMPSYITSFQGLSFTSGISASTESSLSTTVANRSRDTTKGIRGFLQCSETNSYTPHEDIESGSTSPPLEQNAEDIESGSTTLPGVQNAEDDVSSLPNVIQKIRVVFLVTACLVECSVLILDWLEAPRLFYGIALILSASVGLLCKFCISPQLWANILRKALTAEQLDALSRIRRDDEFLCSFVKEVHLALLVILIIYILGIQYTYRMQIKLA